MDGASVHKSVETRNYLANLGLKIIITAPYGYKVSPVELLWVSIASLNNYSRLLANLLT